MTLRTWFTGALALLGAVPAAAQSPTAPPPSCTAPEQRQFDFWLGEWTVQGPAGRTLGYNSITRILNGCVIQERWTSVTGFGGESYNVYDQAAGQWHQTWVDNTGALLKLDGGLVGGSMVMANDVPGPNGTRQKNRITWTPLPEGGLRQLWEQSSDNGRTWQVAFDGTYRRRS